MNEVLLLDERYLTWLYSLVDQAERRNPTHYRKLTRHLHTTEFTWFVPNDDNRQADGRELRTVYFHETGRRVRLNPDTASVMEVLMGVADRLAFHTVIEDPGYWYWKLIDHLGLTRYSDEDWQHDTPNAVSSAMSRFLNRRYRPDGRGGLFPLKHPRQDQREVEIWYQMNAYIIENTDL